MADSRHNKYVSVTDWFKPAPGSTTSGTVSGSTGTATSGASFIGGSWGSGGSGGGQTITIIKTNDTTPESNSNVYSALRVHNSFIAKDKDERTEGKLSSDAGFEVGEFVSGVSGAICYVDPETLQTTAELDRLKVRIKAYFETLEIINVNSVGGKQIISPAGSINCIRVDEHGGTIDIQKERQATDEEGNPLYDINGNPIMETYIESVDNGVPEDTYRCYFLAEQDGETIENRFHVGDQAYSQMFDAQPGISSNVSSKYYWRLVTGISYDPIEIAGKKYHYIDLSVSDCDTDSDAPSVGDIICHRGHRTLPGDIEGRDRQNALEFSAVDTFSPSITLYQGIGESDPDNGKYPYSLVGKDIIQYGVNRLNNRAFMNVYGDMYVGDRDGKSYLQFDETAGLTVKGNIQFGSKSKLDGDDMTLEERIQQAAKAYEEDVNQFKAAVEQSFLEVQDQIDGAIETYFLDPIPTLENEPAIDWTTDQIKNAHIGDLYYSGEGKAYRFQYSTDTGYYWNLITDTDITLALANAQKAQDTADSKRKIFVKQPSTNDSYEAGDMWANATYPTNGTPRYSNDLLRAITDKVAGQPFSIDHWVLASKYTDDTAAIAAQEAADEAQRAANNAQSDATAAANRLSSWAADNVISPTEKQGIKEEYVRVIKDKDSIHEQWDQYFLDTTDSTEIGKIYIAYNNAYLPYVEQLIYLFTAKDSDGVALENIPIPDDFDDNQTAYYSNRTIALNTIAAAAKKVADDAQAAANNAYEEAEKALTAAEEAKTSVYGLNTTVTGLKDFTDDAFLDGIINSSERKTIENYIYQINTTLAQVRESYNEVSDNTFLVDSVAKTNLDNSYNAFVTATNELISTINSISNQGSVENIDRAAFEVKYNNFNSKYSDYTKYLNAAIKFIEYAINSRVDTTLQELGGYSYLKNAFNEETTVTGGLVLTSLVALGYTDDNQQYHVMGGINGSHANNDGIAIWAGGSAVDRMIEPNNPNAADFLVRMDGTGYAAGGNFWWESDGTIHADPLSFVISENSVGALLSSLKVYYNVTDGKPSPYALEPLVPFTKLTIASDIELNSNARIALGDVYIAYDSENNAIYFANDKGGVVNFYTTGAMSMFGKGNISVDSIMDAISQNLDPNTLTIQNGVLTVIGGTGGEGINEEQLEDYLTTNNYAKKSDIPSLNGYATQTWVSSQGYITSITSAIVTSALGFTPYNADNFTKAKIKSTLGISDWALAESKPSYNYTEIGNTPDLSIYALKTSLSSYQPLINSTNKLAYSLISGTPSLATVATSGKYSDLSDTPTSLKNPTSLTFGAKTYDGSSAKTIVASDLGALTSHQTIYALTLQAGSFSEDTYTPNSASKTINVPTTTSHISEGDNLYFTSTRAVNALSNTLANYVKLSGVQDIIGNKNFTGGLRVNGAEIVYNKDEGYWKLEGNLFVTGGIAMYGGSDIDVPTGGGGGMSYPLHWSGFSSGSFDGSAAKTIYIPSKLSELTNDSGYALSSALSGYLPLSGGTINSVNSAPLILNSTDSNATLIRLIRNSTTKSQYGYYSPGTYTFLSNETNRSEIRIYDDASLCFITDYKDPSKLYTVWHAGNFNPSDYLPLSGGTIKGIITAHGNNASNVPLVINTPSMGYTGYIAFKAGSTLLGYLGMGAIDKPIYRSSSNLNYDIIHSGNYSSYALPLTGGAITTSETYGITIKSTGALSGIEFDVHNIPRGVVITGDGYGIALVNAVKTYNAIGVNDDGTPYFRDFENDNTHHILLHYGNYADYALPISGGTINSTKHYGLSVNSDDISGVQLYTAGVHKANWGFYKTGKYTFLSNEEKKAELRIYSSGEFKFTTDYTKANELYTVWHSGNFNPSDYLPKTGGDLNGNLSIKAALNEPLTITNTTGTNVGIYMKAENYVKTSVGKYSTYSYLANYKSSGVCSAEIELHNDGSCTIYNGVGNYDVLHSGNYSDYALPLNGGTITSSNSIPLFIKTTSTSAVALRLLMDTTIKVDVGWDSTNGMYLYEATSKKFIGVDTNGTPYYYSSSKYYNLLHANNFSSYAYPKDGRGYMTFDANGRPVLANNQGYAAKNSSGAVEEILWMSTGDTVHIGGTTSKKVNVYGTLTIDFKDALHSGNYNDYAPTKTGTGASGTWGISISGNAATASNADKVDGYDSTAIFTFEGTKYTNGASTLWDSFGSVVYGEALPDGLTGVYNYGQAISFGGSNAKFDIYVSHVSTDSSRDATNGGIYVRSGWKTDKKSWRKLAFMDGNVASATKLETARTLWGQSFDGTGNVSGNMTNVGSITFNKEKTFNIGVDGSFRPTSNTSDYWWGVSRYDTNVAIAVSPVTGTFQARYETVLAFGSGNVGIGTQLPSYKLDVSTNSSDNIVARFTNTSYHGGILINSKTGYNPYIQLQMNNSGVAEIGRSYAKNTLYLGAPGTDVGYLNILLSNGNVGVGTIKPDYKLHIVGDTFHNGETYFQSSSTSYKINIGYNQSTWYGECSLYPLIWSGTSTDYYTMIAMPHIPFLWNGYNSYKGSNTGSTIRMAGQPGSGNGSYWDIGCWTNDYFSIGRNRVGNLNINSSGYVGINCNATAMLSVYGGDYKIASLDSTGNTGCYLAFYESSSEIAGVGHYKGASPGYTFLYNAKAAALTTTAKTTEFRVWDDGGFSLGGTKHRSDSSWYGGTTVIGRDGYNKAIIGNLQGNLVFGSHNSNLDAWAPVYLSGSVVSIGHNNKSDIYVNASGAVGIGTTDPSATLHVAGNILCTGSITMNSMRSMKNIVDERGLSLSELGRIKPTRFRWKDGRDDRLHIGGIADDVMKVLPEVVFQGSDGVLSMDYGCAAFAIGASLIKPVSEHELKIKELECKVKELENELKLLKRA